MSALTEEILDVVNNVSGMAELTQEQWDELENNILHILNPVETRQKIYEGALADIRNKPHMAKDIIYGLHCILIEMKYGEGGSDILRNHKGEVPRLEGE